MSDAGKPLYPCSCGRPDCHYDSRNGNGPYNPDPKNPYPLPRPVSGWPWETPQAPAVTTNHTGGRNV